MKLDIYHLDAFTDRLFSGNPAAVIPLSEWLADEVLQLIAAENNLPETAFFVPVEDGFHIRWFTPVTEVELCGHATLAAAHVLFSEWGETGSTLTFNSLSGKLRVIRDGEWLTLDFPADSFQVAVPPPALHEALSPVLPLEVYKGKTDYLVVLENETELRELAPDIIVLSTIPARGIIMTAPGDETDFVSRFFAPQSGIDEDPVTGSAHTTLIPYWARRLQKLTLSARQISARGGDLRCKAEEDRVLISGKVRRYLQGRIETE